MVAALLDPPPRPEKTGIFFLTIILYLIFLSIILFFLNKNMLLLTELFLFLIFPLNFQVNFTISLVLFVSLIDISSFRLMGKIKD